MSELLMKLAECIEFGKINIASPYPPQMKGQEGADELTAAALVQGIKPQDVLTLGLMPGMERVGLEVQGEQGFRSAGVDVSPGNEYGHVTFKTTLSFGSCQTKRDIYYWHRIG